MPTKATTIIVQSQEPPVRSDSFLDGIARHWLVWFTALTGMWVTLPWLAPMLMHAGATWPAYLIYLLYSPQCHQLPQRSYFLFGDRLMVPLADILAVTGPSDPLELRWFVGTPVLGWKVAWSDRMVSLYTPLFLGAAVYALSGRRWRSPRWRWALLLPYLPLLIDGLSHMVDDIFRLGIRADNAWLAALTSNIFTQAFYKGDALGSFNWWARLLTGLLASAAFVRQIYPLLDCGFATLVPHELPIQGEHNQ
ncbi:MAG: hypothetical protein ABIV47_19850 [Roseiflexaceae bacterium]